MSFITLVYHEVRCNDESITNAMPIAVADGYEDMLPQALFVTCDNFTKQMTYLKERNYHFLTLQEVYDYYENNALIPERSVFVTFDDAFQSLRHIAYPILKELQIPATLFVVKGWLSLAEAPIDINVSKVLSFDEILNMRDVFTFANHTNHLHRRGHITTADETTLFADLDACSRIVDHPHTFAYPFGEFNDTLIEKMGRWGMKYAFTTIPGINTRQTHPLRLHRYVIPYTMNLESFVDIVEKRHHETNTRNT